MSKPDAIVRTTDTMGLADEEEVKQILLNSVLGLWEVVINLTPLRHSRHECYSWPGNIREPRNLIEHTMTLSGRRRIDIPMGVAYGKDLELLLEVARTHPGSSDSMPPALFLGFGDSALKFELRVWTGRFDEWVEIRSALAVAMYAALRGAGMEIPFPQHEVRLRQD
jgi:hypothetical protein